MDDTDQFMHNTFWHEFQVTIIHQIKAEFLATLLDGIFADDDHPVFSKEVFVPLAKLDGLKNFLKEHHFTLTDFSVQDTLRRPGPRQPDDSSLIGKYLFRDQDTGELTIISFFHFSEESVTQPVVDSMTAEMPMPGGTGNADGDGHDGMGEHITSRSSAVIRIVNLINANLNGDWNKVEGTIPVIAASPVWLCAATPPVPEGCPAIPPIPVPGDARCSSSPGLWPITLQDISPELEAMTGDDVTVFILDTLPKPGEIKRAVESAEHTNLLLLDVAYNVTLDYHILPDILDIPSPDQPVTGKDILGRDIGIRMPDHGFFIAGIVRDLAPHARIECIRILSDWCAGDMTTYVKCLADIHDRMSQVDPNTGKEGDLYHKPVVINMSLNATPSAEEAMRFDLTEQVVRDSIRPFFKSLVSLGAVIVASAGNEADIRIGAKAMDPSGIRPGPVLPGALADEITEIIPVGALDRKGNPASYSCYPGPKGVATYGGEIPKPADEKSPDGMTVAKEIDALIGIYSSTYYPALSLDDPHSRYPVPNTNAWAYWVGTSFATPIIAAVAARVYELKLRGMKPPVTSVAKYIVNTVALPRPQSKWTRLDPKEYPPGTAPVRMIKAAQCHPTTSAAARRCPDDLQFS